MPFYSYLKALKFQQQNVLLTAPMYLGAFLCLFISSEGIKNESRNRPTMSTDSNT